MQIEVSSKVYTNYGLRLSSVGLVEKKVTDGLNLGPERINWMRDHKIKRVDKSSEKPKNGRVCERVHKVSKNMIDTWNDVNIGMVDA